MKIIGTGLSGLIGSRIVELLNRRCQFINFSLETGVDILNEKLLQESFNQHSDVSIVLHLAAFTDVEAAWKQRGDKNGPCYRVNVIGTRNIARICAQKGLYLIHISTDYVFNGKKKEFYTEEDEPDPIEWYGKTKYLAEKEVKKAESDFVILRLSFPFKAKSASKNLEPNPKLDLVRKIIKKLQEDEKIFAFHDQIITPTFIDDIVKVIAKVFRKKPLGIFHVVGSTPLSPYELALKTAKIFNLPQEKINEDSLVDYLKDGHNRPRQKYLALSNEKLKKELKIFPLSLRESLKKMKLQLQ